MLWSKAAKIPQIELNLGHNGAFSDISGKALSGAKNVSKLDLTGPSPVFIYICGTSPCHRLCFLGMKFKEPAFIDVCKTLCTLDKLSVLRLEDALGSKNASVEVISSSSRSRPCSSDMVLG